MTPGLTTAEVEVLRALTRAASAGQQCPGNIELCLISGYASPNRAGQVVMRLEDKKLIKVKRTRSSRQVWIVATGQCTAAPIRSDARDRLYEFAGHMSEGCSISEAGRRMGLKPPRAGQLWKRIVDGLGEQAR